ncbi:MAG: DEAD/DEAH box helicase family protein, partial [Chloroflexota bacterium]|nr:DEAD/DEAH box helicase family protein [Chloroflexota bacterium]
MDSQSASSERILDVALEKIAQTSPLQTDGKWLEYLTRDCAPLIADWDVSHAWLWQEWPDRAKHYPRKTDLGADVVARRASDGALIAIQCKSRQLNEHGHGAPINTGEIDRFIAFSAEPLWSERWVVVNGAVKISDNAIDTARSTKPLKRIDIESDIRKQKDMARPTGPEPCPHCDGSGVRRTRDCMQEEAIGTSAALLQEHAKANGSSKARGRIILPCGTGKSRIALRIVERLTEPGQVSAVLCPSIALVSQLRAEFLAHCAVGINALAVCSDEGVAKDRDLASDPTADLGYASASEVKGLVTTRADEIGQWIDDVTAEGDRIGVIFGTYQSSHRIADALGDGRQVQVLVADEAHRTAGLRRITNLTERLRDFTVCHDDARFPSKYRIYQTATPRIYT